MIAQFKRPEALDCSSSWRFERQRPGLGTLGSRGLVVCE